ncbi:MAG TPA: DUF1570 domain-containing protein [Pirellulales bacterium]
MFVAPSIRRAALLILLASWPADQTWAASGARTTLALEMGSVRLEGFALARTSSTLELMGRDGRLWSLPNDKAQSARQISPKFRSYTAMEVRERLTRELGKAFEVTGTGHYLVAHPRGAKDVWSPRFEDLYRHFIHYFSVRGFQPREPEFPLVAIVWPDRQQFMRYAAREGDPIGARVLGYYSPKSNRITLYDAGGTANSAAWHQNADTIIHEATHQTAFNTGVHRRFAQTPKWVAEGLGTMFEAPGVWKSESNRRFEDRINRGRLRDFQHFASSLAPGALPEFVSSDRMFTSDPARAYALAWSLSFFLVETQSHRYSDYLRLTARRPAFENYSASARLADFTSIFGNNFALLEKRWLQFICEIK